MKCFDKCLFLHWLLYMHLYCLCMHIWTQLLLTSAAPLIWLAVHFKHWGLGGHRTACITECISDEATCHDRVIVVMSASEKAFSNLYFKPKDKDLFLLRLVTFIYIQLKKKKKKKSPSATLLEILCVVQVLMKTVQWDQNTAFLGACAGSSEAVQCMCHTVLFDVYRHWGSMDSRRQKVQHQIKTVFYPQLPGRLVFCCLFLHRITKGDCSVGLNTLDTM